jgi:hypothetical protein
MLFSLIFKMIVQSYQSPKWRKSGRPVSGAKLFGRCEFRKKKKGLRQNFAQSLGRHFFPYFCCSKLNVIKVKRRCVV